MRNLILYSRPDCHLCEVAAGMLSAHGYSNRLEVVDIEDDLELVRRYGIRVPVLQRTDTNAELSWPFEDSELVEFLV
jgi:hypothetical protein